MSPKPDFNNFLQCRQSYLFDVVFYLGDVTFVSAALLCKLFLSHTSLLSCLLDQRTNFKGFKPLLKSVAFWIARFPVLVIDESIK